MLSKIHDALQVINLGFPNYCLGHGLMDLAYNQYLTEYYTQIGIIRFHFVVNDDHFMELRISNVPQKITKKRIYASKLIKDIMQS